MLINIVFLSIGLIFLTMAIVFMTGRNAIPFKFKPKKHIEKRNFNIVGLYKFMGRSVFLPLAIIMFITTIEFAIILPQTNAPGLEWAFVLTSLFALAVIVWNGNSQITGTRFIIDIKQED